MITKEIMFVILLTGYVPFTHGNETCWNRFEYEYNVIEKLVTLEREKAQMNATISQLTTTIAWLLRTVTENTGSIGEINGTINTMVRNYASSSTTYILWGRTSCPTDAGAELVYEGYAAGGHYTHSGGSTNYMCLPFDPNFVDVSGGYKGQLYGTEYRTTNTELNGVHQQDVPCAVCRIPRVNVIMIPGRNHCHDGWIKEYNGYLMGGYYSQTGPSENICVDRSPEIVDGGYLGQTGALLYLIQIKCGAMKCPPYEDGRDLTCTVCSYSGSVSP